MSEQEKEESGFIVNDKRSSYQSDEEIQSGDAEKEKEDAKRKQQEAQSQEHQQHAGAPEIDFSTFVMSLASSAFYHLGDMPDPMTGQIEQNLPAVRQTIDILAMLHQKTKGNLDAQEDKLLGQLVYELQMKYVAKQK